MRRLGTILVTGGCGFIGSNFILSLLDDPGFDGRVVNLDALTYAGNAENLGDAERRFGPRRYVFERGDICDRDCVDRVFARHDVDTVVHFAAESHVDRSILGPEAFVRTNVLGTFVLLESARNFWKDRDGCRFHHVGTDEVFGSLGKEGRFDETTPYDPRSPYSASKAASDHLVRAYHHTYGLDTTVSNCSNNYGPRQFPEKFIPLMVLNMRDRRPLPVYGDGRQVRDWLHVDDHSGAIRLILRNAAPGSTYAVGGENEWENIHLLHTLMRVFAARTGTDPRELDSLIAYVADRPGHDRRYAIDCSRLKRDLGWTQSVDFERGLDATVAWYLANPGWVERVRNGEYRKWIGANYTDRKAGQGSA